MHPHSVRRAVERVPPATAVAAAGVVARVPRVAAAEVRALVAVAAVDAVAVVAAVDVVDNGSAWT